MQSTLALAVMAYQEELSLRAFIPAIQKEKEIYMIFFFKFCTELYVQGRCYKCLLHISDKCLCLCTVHIICASIKLCTSFYKHAAYKNEYAHICFLYSKYISVQNLHLGILNLITSNVVTQRKNVTYNEAGSGTVISHVFEKFNFLLLLMASYWPFQQLINRYHNFPLLSE